MRASSVKIHAVSWAVSALVAITSCSISSNEPPPVANREGTKLCDGLYVSTTNPDTGCAGSDCSPCRLPNATPTCSEAGACKIALCAQGHGDCNGAAEDGCETDLTTSLANCGGCGNTCTPAEACIQATCLDKTAADVQAWLAAKNEGLCFSSYNQMMNLCGDVEYCFDPRFMRAYPTGLAVDLVFQWDGSASGVLANFGGDCDDQRLAWDIQSEELIAQSHRTRASAKITPGKHLASVQLNDSAMTLWVDGVLVSEGPAPTVELRLLDKCGPGLVLGQRGSYWYESEQRETWFKHAASWVHLRENLPDVRVYDFAKVTAPHDDTVFLFDETGAGANTWTARVGGLVGVAKNPVDLAPEIGLPASGPLPEWKPFDQCF